LLGGRFSCYTSREHKPHIRAATTIQAAQAPEEGRRAVADYSPYQRKIIDRYYKNFDAIKLQQLSDWATDLYLAEGKKRERIWNQVAASLRKLEFPESRITHLLDKRDPALLVGILKELETRQP
jgi:hypothetical protein